MACILHGDPAVVAAAYRPNSTDGPTGDSTDQPGRLNVLVTDSGQRWARDIPALLEPQGVRSFRATSADEAIELIHATPIHVAVVDLLIDTHATGQRMPGGLKLLRVIQRIEQRPPAVVAVRGRRFDQRIDNFILTEAMKLDAFSVLDTPVELEQMLAVLRRALERFYGGQWPS